MRLSLILASCILWFALPDLAAAKLSYESVDVGDGVRVVVVSGTFEYSDDLTGLLLEVLEKKPSAVMFNSGGGNVMKALELGRILRRLNLMTVQTRELECSSACAFAFLGGVSRFAAPGSIGVHRSSFDGSASLGVEDAVSTVQHLTAEVMAYISEMGADPRLLELSLRYDQNDMRYLSVSEMQQYRVTTPGAEPVASSPGSNPPLTGEASGTQLDVQVPVDTQPKVPRRVNVTIPIVKEAIVHHPKGEATLNSEPAAKATSLIKFQNGKKVVVLERKGSWFKVRAGIFRTGFMHETWLHPLEYDVPLTESRYIQIRSTDTYEEAESLALQVRDASVFLSSNGWFAITLSKTFSPARGNAHLKDLKSKGLIPEDSFLTYGNTYVRKLCCD